MYRARRLPAVLGPTLIAVALFFGLPQSEAEAARPKRVGGFDGGGYLYLTPGSFVLPIVNDDFTDLDPSFGWGFGGGYMFARGRLFKATVGGVFEHTVLFFDRYDYNDFGAHLLRFMPEARIGLGNNKVWGYGLFGAGVAGTLWHWDADLGPFGDIDGANSAPGFNVQFGGGVQGMVTRHFFLGGELDFDYGLFFEGDDDWTLNNDDDFAVFSVAFEFMLGVYF